jgi:hypothetical protein
MVDALRAMGVSHGGAGHTTFVVTATGPRRALARAACPGQRLNRRSASARRGSRPARDERIAMPAGVGQGKFCGDNDALPRAFRTGSPVMCSSTEAASIKPLSTKI